jgi:para-aminobenzoate synthetase/4-amino-4-deoxychorismate lyase
MDVISALESADRQAFCGALGFASPAAGLELSVAIRTFEVRDREAWLDVGGGVVADSDPDEEAAECLAKARPLLAAIGGRLAEDERPPVPVPVPRRLGPRPVPRPDPSGGVFETLLVHGGIPVAAARHLERLARSARALYGVPLPATLPALVRHTALEQGGPCRLRILLDAAGDVALDVAPLPPPAVAIVLEPVTVPGGIGEHKWRDRRLLDALEGAVGPATPLLVDLDGAVLETTRSSVFALVDGTWITPPADGRILPGVTRARVLDGGEAREAPLDLDLLRAAEAAFAVNALRGLQPVAMTSDDRLRTSTHRYPHLGE